MNNKIGWIIVGIILLVVVISIGESIYTDLKISYLKDSVESLERDVIISDYILCADFGDC